jgi:selenocysteine lyase/cysteine desulfurase
MTSRRVFLASTLGAGVGAVTADPTRAVARALSLLPGPGFARHAMRAVREAASYAGSRTPQALAADEAYWAAIRHAFALDPSVSYLNSAGCSPTPRHVLDGMIADLRYGNEAPVEYMWHTLEPRVEIVRRALAAEFGCDPEELAITRNASEANEIAILGLDLRAGDEVVVTTHNYDRMLTAWDQRARRDGIVVVRAQLDVPPRSDAEVVDRIAACITPRTRVIELPHLTNWTGQPLPVPEVVALGRAHGIEVLVDGAQAFAHVPASRDALGCDYYGASLHKWLLAPVGTGFLYVRRDRVERLWPLMPAAASMRADIRKYEEIGTHPAANHNAILAALAFHRHIGGARKLARLRALRDRWARTLPAESDRIRVRTPLDDPRTGALAFVEVDGLDPVRLHDWLWTRYRMVTSPTEFAGLHGLRVAPNVFTSMDEIDAFTDAMRLALRRGVGSG